MAYLFALSKKTIFYHAFSYKHLLCHPRIELSHLSDLLLTYSDKRLFCLSYLGGCQISCKFYKEEAHLSRQELSCVSLLLLQLIDRRLSHFNVLQRNLLSLAEEPRLPANIVFTVSETCWYENCMSPVTDVHEDAVCISFAHSGFICALYRCLNCSLQNARRKSEEETR